MSCKNCKHWTRKDTDFNYPENLGLGKCNRVKNLWDCIEYNWDSEDPETEYIWYKDKYKGNLAFVQDGSDYHAELVTLGDFSCNQFEGVI